jgi:6,7-dimethyl-8-ribityllumazine synthase
MRAQEQAPAPLADASRLRIGIIVARFNAFVTDRLRDGAVAALREAGAPESAIEIFPVPGAFEIPQAARAVAETGRFDAIVCLGCLIRGETPHFDYIASAAAHGITAAAGETGIPMAFGVLTTNTAEQAVERASEGPDNKGREAAAAAIEMATLYRTLASTQSRPSGFRV